MKVSSSKSRPKKAPRRPRPKPTSKPKSGRGPKQAPPKKGPSNNSKTAPQAPKAEPPKAGDTNKPSPGSAKFDDPNIVHQCPGAQIDFPGSKPGQLDKFEPSSELGSLGGPSGEPVMLCPGINHQFGSGGSKDVDPGFTDFVKQFSSNYGM